MPHLLVGDEDERGEGETVRRGENQAERTRGEKETKNECRDNERAAKIERDEKYACQSSSISVQSDCTYVGSFCNDEMECKCMNSEFIICFVFFVCFFLRCELCIDLLYFSLL